MDIDRVRYFHVFAEMGSVVAASEVLNISQPALSKALKILEHEVGVKLIEADGRGLRLTKAGLAFKKETADLLSAWGNVPRKIQSGELELPTRIGSFEVFTTYFLARLTKFINLETLELHEYGPGRLEQAVADRQIDIGITYVPIPKAGVEFVEVTKVRMGVFGLKKFKNAAIEAIPFAVPLSPLEGTPSKAVGLDGWPDHKFQRNIKYRVTMMQSAMELCRQGLAVAYLPNFIVEVHNEFTLPEFRFVELLAPVGAKERLQSVFLVQHKQDKETTLYRQIAKSLRSLS